MHACSASMWYMLTAPNTANKPLLALKHVLPCHVSKSEARKHGEC